MGIPTSNMDNWTEQWILILLKVLISHLNECIDRGEETKKIKKKKKKETLQIRTNSMKRKIYAHIQITLQLTALNRFPKMS